MKWSDVEASFQERLRVETLSQILARVSQDGYLPLTELEAIGLTASFDLESLEIAVEIPPRLLRTRSVRLSGRTLLDANAPKARPSDWSGFLNVRMLGGSQMGGGQGEGLLSPSFSLEQMINVRNWVFEQGGTLDTAGKASFGRQYSRLIRDVPSKRVRYALGDLRTSAVSFQDSVPLIGFAFERENRLQPFHQPRPRAHSELFIERESEVEILVNGDRVRRLHLTPGPYRIEDLQLSAGSNEVEMVVTDKYGIETRIDLSFAFDQALLATNESDYYLGFGWKPQSGGLDEGYAWNEPVLSGFYRWGRSDVLTREWNVQASRDVAQLGSSEIWASRIGTFRSELGASSSAINGLGYALGLSYIRYSGRGAGQRNQGQWRVDLHHYSPKFQGIDSLAGHRPVLNFQIAHSRQLPGKIGASLGLGFRRLRGQSPNSVFGRASLSKRFSRSMSGRLNLNMQSGGGRETLMGANLRLEWSFGRDRSHRLGTAVNTHSRTRELQYSYQPLNSLRSWRGSADLKQRDDGGWLGDLRAGYISPRAELDLNQSITEHEGKLMATSRFQIGSSLAFAGGHWGISRPINDAFVVVTKHESLKGIPVGLNNLGQGEEASVNRWGPAVISDVQSYYPKSIRVDPPDEVAFGYDLGPGRYVAEASYRSGAHLSIGEEPTVFVSGQLRDERDAPVSLQAGEVHLEGDADWDPPTVFTTREGLFTIEGLRPGSYSIRWFDERLDSLPFDISEDVAESLELGILVVKEKEEE